MSERPVDSSDPSELRLDTVGVLIEERKQEEMTLRSIIFPVKAQAAASCPLSRLFLDPLAYQRVWVTIRVRVRVSGLGLGLELGLGLDEG